jgi:hypothetical protein
VDEVQRLLLQVEGREKLEALNASLAKEMDFLNQLREIQKQGVVGVSPAQIEAAARSVVDLNRQIADVQKGTKDFSGSALQLGYVLDDLTNTSGDWTRKLASISNNIPGLIMSLGLGGGVAGMIGLISTGLIALTPVVKNAMGAFTGPDALPRVKALLDDAAERVKGLQGELDKLMKSRPMKEKQTASEVEFLVGEEGPEKLIRGIAAGMGAAGDGARMTDAERQRIKNLRGALGGSDDERVVAAIRQAQFEINGRITGENERMAAEMLASAPTSAASRRRIGRYLPEFGEALASTEPEADEAGEAQVQAVIDEGNRAHEAGVARRKRAAEHARKSRATAQRDARRTAEDIATADEAERAHEQKSRATAQRDARRTAEDIATADEAERARPREAARAQILQAGEQMGLPAAFTGDQVNEMADEVVRLGKQGVDTNTAILATLSGKVRQMQRLSAQMQAQAAWANQLGMGSDQSGDFSAMPPLLGSGFGN